MAQRGRGTSAIESVARLIEVGVDGQRSRRFFMASGPGVVITGLGVVCPIGIGDKAYWGRGYGRDALRTLLDYAFRLRNFRRVHLTVNSTNERAMRAYRACGFVEEGRLRQHVWSDGCYIDLVHMGLLRDEWENALPRSTQGE